MHDLVKSEEFFFSALDIAKVLYKQNPDAYRIDLASIYSNMGVNYYDQPGVNSYKDLINKELSNNSTN